MRFIQPNELNCPQLNQLERSLLFAALNGAIAGEEQGLKFHVSFRYSKQTTSPQRIAGMDYVESPGVAMDAVQGPMTVKFYTDNPENRRKGRVGKPYLHVCNVFRADGINPFGHESVRIEAIREFRLVGTTVPSPQTTQSP